MGMNNKSTIELGIARSAAPAAAAAVARAWHSSHTQQSSAAAWRIWHHPDSRSHQHLHILLLCPTNCHLRNGLALDQCRGTFYSYWGSDLYVR